MTGPRQSGKTTLARAAFGDKLYVSLEDPIERAFAQEDPRGFLARFPDGAVFDEAQRWPELFSHLQGIVDRSWRPGLFVLTGSQQFGLLAGITQSLPWLIYGGDEAYVRSGVRVIGWRELTRDVELLATNR